MIFIFNIFNSFYFCMSVNLNEKYAMLPLLIQLFALATSHFGLCILAGAVRRLACRLACKNSRPSSLTARVAYAKRHSGRERRRTAVFADYLPTSYSLILRRLASLLTALHEGRGSWALWHGLRTEKIEDHGSRI